MRALLESSWMKFGPAGRGSYDWVTGPPSTQEKPGFKWNELQAGDDRKSELAVYIVLPVVSVLLLALLLGLVYRRCSRSKLSLAGVIALDLQDAESSAEFLSSLTRNAERHTSTSSDGSDGVFVMVYLPPPYEETLTKITRAASLSSSKDVESIKIEDLEAKLCPELKSSGQYV
ncbi:small integral membrane protein 28 [Salarias fasciatus]|uniref:small integral membrane protein 28 n=1 Tax=Salarias fasciatus TaxID=181472 RepID=UPI001176D778|nr:small integral membrane protein 28 [Salarias fasciatus]